MKNTIFYRAGLLVLIILLPGIASASRDTLPGNSGTNSIPVSSGWIPVRAANQPTEAPANAIPVTILYRVQILALQHPINVETVKVNGIDGNVITVKGNDLTRYYMGEFHDLKSALDFRDEIVKSGFEDACIVAYNNGERITIKESLSLLGDNK
jgi:hypothetical protein